MNRNTSKITGILSSLIYIIISFFFYYNSIKPVTNSGNTTSISLFLELIQIIALFFIFYSASEIIKEFSPINLSNLIYFFIGIEISFFVLRFLNFDIQLKFQINNILYILIYLVLGIMAAKLLKVKNTELNISFFKIFIISNLIILFLLNTFNYFFIKNINILNISFDESIILIKKFTLISVLPYVFALIFFFKPYNNKTTH